MEEMKEELQGLKEVVLILKDRDEAAARSRETTQTLLRGLEAAMMGVAARNAVEEEVRRMGMERGAAPGHPLQVHTLQALPLQSLPLTGSQAGFDQPQGMVSVQSDKVNRHSINKRPKT